ncbi:MAG: hypothetical protein WBE47_15335, partial [Candidatus Acidiferrales bacterium]
MSRAITVKLTWDEVQYLLYGLNAVKLGPADKPTTFPEDYKKYTRLDRTLRRKLKWEAKGRIERLFETLQDRLVKEMRLAGIDSIAAANHFLETRFVPEWEQRFTVAARNPRNVHRQLGREQHLEEILSVRVARKVAQDHTVSWEGNRWGVVREEVCAGLRGAAVEIERRLDGSHWLRYRGRYLRLRSCPEPVRPSASPGGRRPQGLAEQIPKPENKIKHKYHVPAEHPWRRPWKRTFLLGGKADISTL